MSPRIKTLCVLSLFAFYSLNAEINIPPQLVVAASALQNAKVSRADDKYFVENNGKKTELGSHCVDRILRTLTPNQLDKFIKKDNYVALSETRDSNNEIGYNLSHTAKLKGGGPLFGVFAWAATHAVGIPIIGLASLASGPFFGVTAAGGTLTMETVAAWATIAAAAAPTP